MKKEILMILVTIFFSCLLLATNLPNSREATFVESYSSAEVTIRAAGIGEGDAKAEDDAVKSAIYFVLFSGTDPILSNSEAKNKFDLIAEEFFDSKNVNKFITWRANRFEDRIKIDKKKVKVIKFFRVNKKMLTDYLVEKQIIQSLENLTETIGNPVIMVIPHAVTKDGPTPLDLLKDPNIKKGAQVIESYLTARKYEVIIPEQTEQINNLVSIQKEMKGQEIDLDYQLALTIGSDVYISYTITIDRRNVSGTQTRKASVGVSAYETTTGRLLGTETGYSHELATSSDAVVIEEAINGAIENVLARINAYWTQDIKKGIQYKLIINLDSNLSEDTVENIQEIIGNLLDDKFSKYKENILTKKTMDYLIWADPEEFDKSSKVFRTIKKAFDKEMPGITIKQENINRKLILLKIVER